MSPIQTQQTRARAAAGWLTGSGIQDPLGGFARYYRGDFGRNARVSTEITGYAISALVYLSGRTGDEQCLESARRAAEFLTTVAWDSRLELFPFEYPADDRESLAYFFDSGIIVRGLLSLWRATGHERVLSAAIQAGEAMHQHFVADDSIHPILRLPACDPLPWTAQWSRQLGCYQLKAAMAWSDLGRETGEGKFFEWYESTLAAALRTQASFLPAETPERTMDRLHAYCYFLEGLMPAADRAEIRSALRDGIQRVSKHLNEIAPVFERSDVYAQLLRVRLLADQAGAAPLDRSAAQRERNRIPHFQMDGPGERFEGGYAFGRKDSAIIPHMNPVSTAFCSQALEMWDDFEAGRLLEIQSLI